ncbi:hypothetical protein E2C01_052310 [Portunus trituberculatus]|uniref:Uncharacterized protein n=1 Tax=Portunus trituberculatus TaxID=210409 RepID=A0A5B7GH78_PORTR|nr:hypothetical protein [Portunus trituberculatus]
MGLDYLQFVTPGQKLRRKSRRALLAVGLFEGGRLMNCAVAEDCSAIGLKVLWSCCPQRDLGWVRTQRQQYHLDGLWVQQVSLATHPLMPCADEHVSPAVLFFVYR